MDRASATGEHVTVLRPRSTAGDFAKAGAVLVVVGVLGDLLELLAFLFVPVARIPPVRRWLERDDVPQDGIEVRPQRVTAVGRQSGRGIDGVRGAVLSVREVGGTQVLYVVGTSGEEATVDVGGYDIDEVGRVLLAHGWAWQPPGGAVTYPRAPAVVDDSTPEFEVVLRDGSMRPLPAKVIGRGALVMAGLALVGYFVAYALGVRGAYLVLVVIGFSVLFALCVVVLAIVWQWRSRLTFAVDDRRIVVRYGAISKLVVARGSVVHATAMRRWLRVRQRGQPFRTYLPIAPRRAELLTALRTYGWPVRDELRT